MIILGIETSCDETGAAILQQKNGRIQILSNVVASSAQLQAKYGGIIPEQAAREQIKSIIPVIEEALNQAAKTYEVKSEDLVGQLSTIAVTQGPGLIGSLLVGVETAKVLAKVWNKPLIPVNHLIGHFYANWITIESSDKSQESKKKQSRFSTLATSHSPSFPCIGLLASGGHTDLVLFKNHGRYQYLGGTRDDAAGECFDKCARLLGLPYPGGPEISKLATKGKDTFKLPRPMIDSDDFDFSFSGLKTAVANLLHTFEVELLKNPQQDTSKVKCNLAASIEAAIVDVLVAKTVRAAQAYNIEQIMVAGGVAANQKLIPQIKKAIPYTLNPIPSLFAPPPYLCTDNAAMIAAAAFFSPRFARLRRGFAGEVGQKLIKKPLDLQADPNLSLSP